jgi:hypothetical protein
MSGQQEPRRWTIQSVRQQRHGEVHWWDDEIVHGPPLPEGTRAAVIEQSAYDAAVLRAEEAERRRDAALEGIREVEQRAYERDLALVERDEIAREYHALNERVRSLEDALRRIAGDEFGCEVETVLDAQTIARAALTAGSPEDACAHDWIRWGTGNDICRICHHFRRTPEPEATVEAIRRVAQFVINEARSRPTLTPGLVEAAGMAKAWATGAAASGDPLNHAGEGGSSGSERGINPQKNQSLDVGECA